MVAFRVLWSLGSIVSFVGSRYVVDRGGTQLHVNPDTGRILDSYGRERLFHGTNIVYKTAPFHPARGVPSDARYSFVAEDMELLASMGYNTIRLGISWAGVEPTEGEVNESFIETVAGIVQEAGEGYGLYSLLDHHQDAYSTALCGTGFPSWTVADTADKYWYKLLGRYSEFPAPLAKSFKAQDFSTIELSLGVPNRSLCFSFNNYNWPAFHFTFQTGLSYEELYQNVKGKRDKFAAYWARVAKRFAGSSYVLGYELMNEPFAGDPYRHPLDLIPGVADRERLQQMYDELSDAIRMEDPAHLVFFQSVTWEVVVPFGERWGFTHVPGGDAYRNLSVLSFHNSVLARRTPDDVYYKWKRDEAKRLGCAMMVTENGNNAFLTRADEFVAGWMHWDYKNFANWTWDNGGIMRNSGDCNGSALECVDKDLAKSFVRAYPMAVAGNIKHVDFDSASGVGHFSYTPSADFVLSAPTVYFVPEQWYYEQGYELTISPLDVASWNASRDFVTIYHFPNASRIGEISVTVRPRVVAVGEAVFV